ncbi:MAG: preprotein translocase subunit YajC [Fibrobacteria bacterium]|nr:preprotein translocase subunit YajC [Fibrobacteria bacterium]
MLFPVLLIGVFFLFIIRPQMREKKEYQKMLAALKKGDKVITNSGMYAEIYAMKDDTRVTLKVGENMKIDFTKASIAKVVNENN